MTKVFNWLEFLKRCEIKTIFGVMTILLTLFGTLYAAQRWIIRAEELMCEGREAIEKAKERDKEVSELKNRVIIVENNYTNLDKKIDNIDGKLNILIARK